MRPDPLMPATQRLPMNPLHIPIVHDEPTATRPFVLRGATTKPTGAVIEAKHRTEPTQREVEQKTNLDNREVDDSYTVPDD